MQQGNHIFELKGQARRLRVALAEQAIPLTHAAALNLIARAHGSRNWESFEASGGVQDSKVTSEDAADGADELLAESTRCWLNWLEAALRFCQVDETGLDELVHATCGEDEASQINNGGLAAQLDALLVWHAEAPARNGSPRAKLIAQLEEAIPGLELPMPESTRRLMIRGGDVPASYARHGFAIPVSVTICASSSFEDSLVFDALEWFANQATDDISRFIVDELRYPGRGANIPLWVEEHSEDPAARTAMKQFMLRMRLTRTAHDEVVGASAFVSAGAVTRFVRQRMATGECFSDQALEVLGLKRK